MTMKILIKRILKYHLKSKILSWSMRKLSILSTMMMRAITLIMTPASMIHMELTMTLIRMTMPQPLSLSITRGNQYKLAKKVQAWSMLRTLERIISLGLRRGLKKVSSFRELTTKIAIKHKSCCTERFKTSVKGYWDVTSCVERMSYRWAKCLRN